MRLFHVTPDRSPLVVFSPFDHLGRFAEIAPSIQLNSLGGWCFREALVVVHPDLLESETQIFTGTVQSWNGSYGLLLTDSGVRVHFMADDQSKIQDGMRLTVSARRFKPLYRAVSLQRAQ